MAEMVASAVVGETLSRISTVLIDKPDKRSSERDDMERLEMAHIKMEAALHMSGRWQIVDLPMLQWRSRLKRAAQECDDTLRRCKQRAQEDEETRRSSSFPEQIARTTMSFMAYFTTDAGCSATVRRFERFAKGTSEFLNMVEFGGRHYTFFNPLIGNLLTGKTLRYKERRGDKFYCLIVRPMSFVDRGMEAMLSFVCKDLEEHAKSFSLGLFMRLCGSSDKLGIIIRCMQLTAIAPHFMSVAAEDARRELIQLPTQDFSWLAHSPHSEDLIEIHSTLTQWYRPDPLCCYDHDPSTFNNNTNNSTTVPLYPEEIIVVYLQCRILLANKHQSRLTSTIQHARRRRRSQNSVLPPIKLGILSIPHFFSRGKVPTAEGYVYEVIDGNEQRIVQKNACLQDIEC